MIRALITFIATFAAMTISLFSKATGVITFILELLLGLLLTQAEITSLKYQAHGALLLLDAVTYAALTAITFLCILSPRPDRRGIGFGILGFSGVIAAAIFAVS